MSASLGENLRAAREQRGVSVSEVAEQTRIAPMYIECIENDNYKPLPGGIFNKGFVKSYARFIGYDEQQALQEYNQLLGKAEVAHDEHTLSYRPEVLTDDRASQSTVPTIIFAGIILALMTGGVLFLVNYLQSQPAAPVVTNSATNQEPQVETRDQERSNSGSAPTMQTLRVEFRTATEPISLSATSDGKSSVNTVTPSAPQVFEPRENLKLSFAKSLAESAQLLINGKQIALPMQPANPRRIPIELEINGSNLAQIWNAGAISFETSAVPASTPATTSPVAVNGLSNPVPRSAQPTASPRSSPAASNTVRPRPTPIIVGGNRNAAAKPSPN